MAERRAGQILATPDKATGTQGQLAGKDASGGHRLAAVKRLGLEYIECFVVENESDDQARLWEIAENLHRAELTALERAEQIAEWIRSKLDHPKLQSQRAREATRCTS
jgi:ParB-like nuclease domain